MFAARDLKHDPRVAIKVMRADVASAVSAERFTREILIAAGLTHPHILVWRGRWRATGERSVSLKLVSGWGRRRT